MNFTKIICVLVLTCFSFSCNDSPTSSTDTCTPITNSDQYIELINPKGGETFKLGDTVNVQWKVNKNKMTSVLIQLSTDNKKTWKDVYSLGEPVNGSDGDFACMEKDWVVGSETQTIGYSTTGETQVFLRVANYDDKGVNDVSSSISVVP